MKLEAIQIVRGIAAIMVAVCHIYNDGWLPGAIVDFGAFGVDLFFVISGFIMCLTAKLDNKVLFYNAKDFLMKRIVRIFPLYLLCAIPLIAYVTVKMGYQGWYYYFGNVLLLPSFTNDPNYVLALPPGWTLVYEMLFYYLFTGSLLFFRSKTKLFAFVFFVIVGTVILVNTFNLVGPRLSWVNFSFIIGHSQVLNFAFGIIVYFIYINLREMISISIFQWLISSCVLSFVVILLIYLKSRNVVVELAVAFLIIMLTTLTKNNFSISPIGRFMLLIGNASYSIYLLHYYFAFFKPKVLLLGAYLLPNTSVLLNVVDLGLLLGAIYGGMLLYKYVEVPITKVSIERLFKKKAVLVNSTANESV